MYVDDADIIATSNHNLNDERKTLKRMQETLDAWEAAVKATGGKALELKKSFGYLVYFKLMNGV